VQSPLSAGNTILRDEILQLLEGGRAHADFEGALGDFPISLRGALLPGSPHTPWQLLEHLRLAQWDILEFCRNPSHVSPGFPEGYWPKEASPPDETAWDLSLESFLEDRDTFADWVRDPSIDLLAPVPDAEGPALLHELLLASAHNSYHLGQLLLLRRSLER
jgi:DinB family protein